MDADTSGVRRPNRGDDMMGAIADEEARQRFAHELNHNFSVIASAGSGKTRAISDRVVQIAKDRSEWLPQLVVVTYTNRAADEMQQRTRQQILEAGLSLEVIEAFNRAFFGTIHSFCVKLLATHGHHLGLPANLELITDDDDLWNEFVQQHTTIGRSLSEKNRGALLRHMQVRQLMELARRQEINLTATQPDTPCPACDFSDVYAAVSKSATNIPKAKEQLREWEKRWRETNEFVPWPLCATTSREFVWVWRETFRPLREWVNACALCVAAEVQRDYRDFRLERGAVTYADQVALAAELLRLPEVARRIREKNYRVILDEAQDTDPRQFFILLEIARPVDVEVEPDLRALSQNRPPRAGHFCMVGDFQQSIYRGPSDLAHYQEIHESLVATGAADELKFSVTFRLDQAQLDFVNKIFSKILNDIDGQVEFVELSPRPDVLQGQVIRFELGDVDLMLPEIRRAQMESRQLAKWLCATGLHGLRARSWAQVAILCPRKAWLRSLRDALLDFELPVEVHSESDREGENPAYAWLTALLVIMVDPRENYEIVGVLREVFGVSDDELARFAQGHGGKFQIAERTRERGLVGDTLNNLVRLRAALERQPLFTAVQEIVRVTQLRERLRSLPSSEFGEVTEELEILLSAAAAAEIRKSSLSDFAQALQRKFHATRETHPSTADAIQLITAHKAKGSEWDAVIVPFLAREVRLGAPAYPRIINGDQPQIAFDRTDLIDVEETLERTQRQQMERLLYVALTRARHTLVLALDSEFFRGAKGQVHTDTQLKCLQADNGEANAEVVFAIASEANACGKTASRQGEMRAEEVDDSLAALQLETGWIDLARQKAAVFIETMSPSKFSPEEEIAPTESADVWVEVEPELRPPRIDSPATRYGVWWHEFVQQIPWLDDAAAWDKVFAATHVDSPDMARSTREWRLLRERISSVSEFPSHFANGARVVHTEMPFFWRMDEHRCLEGIVDLAFFDPGEKKWFILDWKTNRVTRDRIEILRVHYRPQIAAYWKAVTEMTGALINAGIYSTSTGEFVVYGHDELVAEWERLRNLPKPDFAEHIGRVSV